MKSLNITKDLFVEVIESLERQYRHDLKCSEAFKVILPNDYVSVYDNSHVTQQLIRLLEIGMEDNNKWIDYYIWELSFGKGYKKGNVIVEGKDFELKTASDLWNLINI